MTRAQSKAKILLVDDETGARTALAELLREEGFEVQAAGDGFKALGKLDGWTPDICVTDIKMPGLDGLGLMRKLRERQPEVPVIMMTAFASIESAVGAIREGADDYLTKPLQLGQLLHVIERVLENRALRQEAEHLRRELDSREREAGVGLIGRSRAFRDMMGLVAQVASSDASVLLVGENGSGKETVARRLHEASARNEAPFVTVHCAALDAAGLERELFGWEEGAFAGAGEAREGRLHQASGGTIFLDEVGGLSQAVQARLLETLQRGEAERLGGTNAEAVDVRVVAATDRDLKAEVDAGRFREDLFYRLNVITIRTPSLRERRDDIALLAMHFLRSHAAANRKTIVGFSERALGVLLNFEWPGNIQQLENVIERAVVMCRGDEVEPRDLPREIMVHTHQDAAMPTVPGSTLRELERFAILRTLEHVGGSTSKAAKILGISPRKIQYRVNEYREEDATATN